MNALLALQSNLKAHGEIAFLVSIADSQAEAWGDDRACGMKAEL